MSENLWGSMDYRKNNIRTRMFFVIFIVLLSSFTLIGFIFNVAASRYIQSSAVAQLDRSIEFLQEEMNRLGRAIYEFPRELYATRPLTIALRRNDFRIESNMFVVDSNLNLLGTPLISDKAEEIIQYIHERNIRMETLNNRMINTQTGTFYVSSYYLPVMQTSDNAYWVFYVDITGLFNFAREINMFLIGLVFVMFIVSVFAAFFLSASITQPIKKLSTLALNIGQGDFSPIDYNFKDREFDDLNLVLNKSARQLGNYDAEQKAFFQNVSHELRTPLMSIQCYAEGINFGLMEPKDASSTILEETSRLSEMVKDLLYISRIDNITSSNTFTDMDIVSLVKDCVSRQEALANSKNITINFEQERDALLYRCSAELMSRAVENLLSNAIRYAKSMITVSCQKLSGSMIINIADDGEGIPEDIIPHVFERFFKGDNGNHGIGLSIVKSIVEQHGGNIKAENSLNGGAVFIISLPDTRS